MVRVAFVWLLRESIPVSGVQAEWHGLHRTVTGAEPVTAAEPLREAQNDPCFPRSVAFLSSRR